MAKRLLLNKLRAHLGDYLQDFDKDSVKISTLSGVIELHNVSLRPECASQLGLDAQQLPLRLCSATARLLRLEVPWGRLGKEPVRVKLEGVRCILDATFIGQEHRSMGGSSDGGSGNSTADASSDCFESGTVGSFARQCELQRLRALRWATFKAEAKAQARAHSRRSSQSASLLQKLMLHILYKLELDINDVHIRIERVAGGASGRAASNDTARPSVAFGMCISKMVITGSNDPSTVHADDAKTTATDTNDPGCQASPHVLNKRIAIEGFAVYCDDHFRPPMSRTAGRTAPTWHEGYDSPTYDYAGAPSSVYILHPFSVILDVDRRISKVGTKMSGDATPRLRLCLNRDQIVGPPPNDRSQHSLRIRLSPGQLLHVSSFLSCVESHGYLQPFEPLRPRPSDRRGSEPISRSRWHFAISTVRGLLARARGRRTRWGPELLARMQQRRRYHALYCRVIEASAAPLQDDEVKELLALEDILDPRDIARFRTLALDDVEEKNECTNDAKDECDADLHVESRKDTKRHWALGRLGRLAAAATSKVSSAARAAGRAAGNVVRSGASAAAKGVANVAGGFTSRGLGLSQEEMAALEDVLQALHDEDTDFSAENAEMNVALAVSAKLSIDLSLCSSHSPECRHEDPLAFHTTIECFGHRLTSGAWKCEVRALSLEGTTRTSASPHHHGTGQRVPILFCLEHENRGHIFDNALDEAQFICCVEHFVTTSTKEAMADERDYCIDMRCAPFNLSISPAIVECWWQWSKDASATSLTAPRWAYYDRVQSDSLRALAMGNSTPAVGANTACEDPIMDSPDEATQTWRQEASDMRKQADAAVAAAVASARVAQAAREAEAASTTQNAARASAELAAAAAAAARAQAEARSATVAAQRAAATAMRQMKRWQRLAARRRIALRLSLHAPTVTLLHWQQSERKVAASMSHCSACIVNFGQFTYANVGPRATSEFVEENGDDACVNELSSVCAQQRTAWFDWRQRGEQRSARRRQRRRRRLQVGEQSKAQSFSSSEDANYFGHGMALDLGMFSLDTIEETFVEADELRGKDVDTGSQASRDFEANDVKLELDASAASLFLPNSASASSDDESTSSTSSSSTSSSDNSSAFASCEEAEADEAQNTVEIDEAAKSRARVRSHRRSMGLLPQLVANSGLPSDRHVSSTAAEAVVRSAAVQYQWRGNARGVSVTVCECDVSAECNAEIGMADAQLRQLLLFASGGKDSVQSWWTQQVVPPFCASVHSQRFASAHTLPSATADSDQRIAITVSPLHLIVTTRVLSVAQHLGRECSSRFRLFKTLPSAAKQRNMQYAMHSASRRKTSLLLLPLPMLLSNGIPAEINIAGATRCKNGTCNRQSNNSKMRRRSKMRNKRENDHVNLGLRKRSLLFTSEDAQNADRASILRDSTLEGEKMQKCGKQCAMQFSRISVCVQTQDYDVSTAAEPDAVWCNNGGALRVSASDIWLALDTMKATKYDASLSVKMEHLNFGVCPVNVDKISASFMDEVPESDANTSLVPDHRCSSAHNDLAAKYCAHGTSSRQIPSYEHLNSTETIDLLDAIMEVPQIEVRCFVFVPATGREQRELSPTLSQVVLKCSARSIARRRMRAPQNVIVSASAAILGAEVFLMVPSCQFVERNCNVQLVDPVDVEIKFNNDGSLRARHNVSDAFANGGTPGSSSGSDSGDDIIPTATQTLMDAREQSYFIGLSAGRAYISSADVGVMVRAAKQSAGAVQALNSLLSHFTVSQDSSFMPAAQHRNSLLALPVADETKSPQCFTYVRVHCDYYDTTLIDESQCTYARTARHSFRRQNPVLRLKMESTNADITVRTGGGLSRTAAAHENEHQNIRQANTNGDVISHVEASLCSVLSIEYFSVEDGTWTELLQPKWGCRVAYTSITTHDMNSAKAGEHTHRSLSILGDSSVRVVLTDALLHSVAHVVEPRQSATTIDGAVQTNDLAAHDELPNGFVVVRNHTGMIVEVGHCHNLDEDEEAQAHNATGIHYDKQWYPRRHFARVLHPNAVAHFSAMHELLRRDASDTHKCRSFRRRQCLNVRLLSSDSAHHRQPVSTTSPKTTGWPLVESIPVDRLYTRIFRLNRGIDHGPHTELPEIRQHCTNSCTHEPHSLRNTLDTSTNALPIAVHVTVLRATGLANVQLLGQQDPYVHLSVESDSNSAQYAQTHPVKDGGCDPVWGRQHGNHVRFRLPSQWHNPASAHVTSCEAMPISLLVSVRNRNTAFDDDRIGHATVTMHMMQTSMCCKQEIPVEAEFNGKSLMLEGRHWLALQATNDDGQSTISDADHAVGRILLEFELDYTCGCTCEHENVCDSPQMSRDATESVEKACLEEHKEASTSSEDEFNENVEKECTRALLVVNTRLVNGYIEMCLRSAMRLTNSTPFPFLVLLAHPSWMEPLALGTLQPEGNLPTSTHQAAQSIGFEHTGLVPLTVASRLWAAERATSAPGAFRIRPDLNMHNVDMDKVSAWGWSGPITVSLSAVGCGQAIVSREAEWIMDQPCNLESCSERFHPGNAAESSWGFIDMHNAEDSDGDESETLGVTSLFSHTLHCPPANTSARTGACASLAARAPMWLRVEHDYRYCKTEGVSIAILPACTLHNALPCTVEYRLSVKDADVSDSTTRVVEHGTLQAGASIALKHAGACPEESDENTSLPTVGMIHEHGIGQWRRSVTQFAEAESDPFKMYRVASLQMRLVIDNCDISDVSYNGQQIGHHDHTAGSGSSHWSQYFPLFDDNNEKSSGPRNLAEQRSISEIELLARSTLEQYCISAYRCPPRSVKRRALRAGEVAANGNKIIEMSSAANVVGGDDESAATLRGKQASLVKEAFFAIGFGAIARQMDAELCFESHKVVLRCDSWLVNTLGHLNPQNGDSFDLWYCRHVTKSEGGGRVREFPWIQLAKGNARPFSPGAQKLARFVVDMPVITHERCCLALRIDGSVVGFASSRQTRSAPTAPIRLPIWEHDDTIDATPYQQHVVLPLRTCVVFDIDTSAKYVEKDDTRRAAATLSTKRIDARDVVLAEIAHSSRLFADRDVISLTHRLVLHNDTDLELWTAWTSPEEHRASCEESTSDEHEGESAESLIFATCTLPRSNSILHRLNSPTDSASASESRAQAAAIASESCIRASSLAHPPIHAPTSQSTDLVQPLQSLALHMAVGTVSKHGWPSLLAHAPDHGNGGVCFDLTKINATSSTSDAVAEAHVHVSEASGGELKWRMLKVALFPPDELGCMMCRVSCMPKLSPVTTTIGRSTPDHAISSDWVLEANLHGVGVTFEQVGSVPLLCASAQGVVISAQLSPGHASPNSLKQSLCDGGLLMQCNISAIEVSAPTSTGHDVIVDPQDSVRLLFPLVCDETDASMPLGLGTLGTLDNTAFESSMLRLRVHRKKRPASLDAPLELQAFDLAIMPFAAKLEARLMQSISAFLNLEGRGQTLYHSRQDRTAQLWSVLQGRAQCSLRRKRSHTQDQQKLLVHQLRVGPLNATVTYIPDDEGSTSGTALGKTEGMTRGRVGTFFARRIAVRLIDAKMRLAPLARDDANFVNIAALHDELRRHYERQAKEQLLSLARFVRMEWRGDDTDENQVPPEFRTLATAAHHAQALETFADENELIAKYARLFDGYKGSDCDGNEAQIHSRRTFERAVTGLAYDWRCNFANPSSAQICRKRMVAVGIINCSGREAFFVPSLQAGRELCVLPKGRSRLAAGVHSHRGRRADAGLYTRGVRTDSDDGQENGSRSDDDGDLDSEKSDCDEPSWNPRCACVVVGMGYPPTMKALLREPAVELAIQGNAFAAAISHDSSALAPAKGWHVVHAAKSVHAWHSHHVLILHDPPELQLQYEKGPRRKTSRREATAVRGDSVMNAVTWFENVSKVSVVTTEGASATATSTTTSDEQGFLSALWAKMAFMMAES